MGTSESTSRSGHHLMKTMPILSHNHRHQYGYHQNYQRSFLHIRQTMAMSSFLTSPSTAYQEPELRLSLMLRSRPTCHGIRRTVIDIARESLVFHFFCIILRLDPCRTGLFL